MGNYSIMAIFDKEPAFIAGAIRSLLMVAILVNVLVLDEKQLAGIAIALELVLTLFVRNKSTANVNVPAANTTTTTATVTTTAAGPAPADAEPDPDPEANVLGGFYSGGDNP